MFNNFFIATFFDHTTFQTTLIIIENSPMQQNFILRFTMLYTMYRTRAAPSDFRQSTSPNSRTLNLCIKNPRWYNNHNIYEYFQSQPTHTLLTIWLCGNQFRPWTRVIIRPWYKTTYMYFSYIFNIFLMEKGGDLQVIVFSFSTHSYSFIMARWWPDFGV